MPLQQRYQRFAQIHHTRLRTYSSSLNNFLFRRQLVNSPLCECGDIEDMEHYILHCPRYNQFQQEMFDTVIRHFGTVSLELLLNGEVSAAYHDNVEVFSAVHDFIVRSRRFQPD